jgi:hypothetical protein
VVLGHCRCFYQPESATEVAFHLGGTSSEPASMTPSARRRNEMHPDELLKPDLFSEILLLGSGEVIFVSLLLIITAALTRA